MSTRTSAEYPSDYAVELLRDRSALGRMIREARKAKGWTTTNLADRMRVSVDSVRRWERGSGLRPPNVVALMNLLDFPGRPVSNTAASVPLRVLDTIQTLYELTDGSGPLWGLVENALAEGLARLRARARAEDSERQGKDRHAHAAASESLPGMPVKPPSGGRLRRE